MADRPIDDEKRSHELDWQNGAFLHEISDNPSAILVLFGVVCAENKPTQTLCLFCVK